MTDRLWDVADLVANIDGNEEAPQKARSLQEANFKVTHYLSIARLLEKTPAVVKLWIIYLKGNTALIHPSKNCMSRFHSQNELM